MLKLNQNYSDYVDMDDPNYPEGKAINASSSESYDGTPLLAEFMNDVNAAHIAMYEKAYGNKTGINGKPDSQKESQFAEAVAKYIVDMVTGHADKRGLADGVHGATSEAVAGQIACRDENGNIGVSAPVNDQDAVNLKKLNDIVATLSPKAGSNALTTCSQGTFGSAATKTAGSAAGNVPLVGTALGTTNNNIVVTDTAGKLKPSGTAIGTAAGKGVDTSIAANTTSTNVPTSAAVESRINAHTGIDKVGTVTSVEVKMNGASKGKITTSGTVDLGTVITEHQSLAGYLKEAVTPSIGDSGYLKLTNGLLIHYGSVTTDSSGGKDITFNPPFANANYAVSIGFQYIDKPIAVGFKNTKTNSFCRIGAHDAGTYVLTYLCIGKG